MTVRFRIESVQLDTPRGMVRYGFPGDLTVLVGHTGVGKTTLLELIKFGLGGDGKLAPVARDHVTDIHISIRIGDRHFQLSRGLAADRQGTVKVLDLAYGEQMPDYSVGGDDRPISSLLLGAMGLGVGLLAAARGPRSTRAGSEITFNDIFRFMYVPQSEMNRDIARSQENYYNPKRKSVFELLFGLTSGDMLYMRSRINTLQNEIEAAKTEAQTISRFLADTNTTSRIDAMLQNESARKDEAEARAMLTTLNEQMSEAIDQQTQVLRDLLNDAEARLGEARSLKQEIGRQKSNYQMEQHRVKQDIDRLFRMASASSHLAPIEFSICPRCTQRLDQRQVPVGMCPVCLQDDVVGHLTVGEQYQSKQLTEQLDEIDNQLILIAKQEQDASEAVASKADLVSALTAEIDQRTTDRVTPRLQSYADAAAKMAVAVERQKAIEHTLIQWDRAEDLHQLTEALSSERDALKLNLRESEINLAQRKEEIFNDLNAEFQSTVVDFGIPSLQTATIDPESYLPILNGLPFLEVSNAGGIITATQVAYWISLVTVAARRRDTYVPAFLLLDSPRLALNAEDDIAGQMYKRFALQVATTPGRFQFILADNELPVDAPGLEISDIAFSYENPTVSSIPHPGPANVQPLFADASPTQQ